MAPRRTRPAGEQTVLETLERSFRLLCTGPAALAVDCRGLAGLPSRPVRLTELRELLLWPDKIPMASREQVWAEMVARARAGGDPAWTVAVAGMVLPGLRHTHTWLCQPDPRLGEDLAAAMLAGLLARLHSLDPDSGRLPAKLVWAARRAGRRLLDEQVEWAEKAGLSLDVLDGAVAPPTPYAHPDLLLAHAVGGGLITAQEAELIGRTRFDGLSLTQAAAELGLTVAAVKMRRHRAERRLVAALRGGRLSRHGYWPHRPTAPADTGLDHDLTADPAGDLTAGVERWRQGRGVTEAA